MIEVEPPPAITRVEPADVKEGFSCGDHALDDYFTRHAVPNDAAGICRAYVLRRDTVDDPALPRILGFYTLSMADEEPSTLAKVLGRKLPKYPSPVALIGRLAVDQRAQGRRLGERLLVDALRRVLLVAEVVGCVGTVVDAKDERAAKFYAKYGFVDLEGDGTWPQRMFLSVKRVPLSARSAV